MTCDNDTGQLEKISAHAHFLQEAMVTEFVNHPRAYVTMQDHRGRIPLDTVIGATRSRRNFTTPRNLSKMVRLAHRDGRGGGDV
jgi:hypothetical protein